MKKYNIDGFVFQSNKVIEEEEYIEPTKIDNIENIFPFSPLQQKNSKKRVKKPEHKNLNELHKNFASEKIIENFNEILTEVGSQIAFKTNNNIFKNWSEELASLIEFTEEKEELDQIDGQIGEIDEEIEKWKTIGDSILENEFIPFKITIKEDFKQEKYNSVDLDEREREFEEFLEKLTRRKNQAVDNFNFKIKQILSAVDEQPRVDPYLILKAMCKIGGKL